MKRMAVSALVSTLTLAACSMPQAARAQYPGSLRTLPPSFTNPAVSPYLNLLQRGQSPAVNYYTIVRPDIEFRNSIGGLQQQVNTQGAIQDVALSGLPYTGHVASFFNYSHYYAPPTVVGRGGGLLGRVGGGAASAGTGSTGQAASAGVGSGGAQVGGGATPRR
jgi:hypothetical protein